MTPSDDPRDDMKRFPTSHDADGLLDGSSLPEDLPDEPAPLAALLSSMRSHVAAHDPAAEQRAIAALAAEIRDPTLVSASGPAHRFGRRAPARAAALAFVAVLATGTAAAAVNGSLPRPVQRALANTLSHVDISVPNPDHPGNNGTGGNGAGKHRAPGRAELGGGSAAPSGPVGPDAGGAAKYGLCTAYAQGPPSTSNGRRGDSTAFSNLEKAASDAGVTPAKFCEGVTAHDRNGNPTPTSGATGSGAGTTTTTATTTTTTVEHGPPTSKPEKGVGPTGPTGHTGTTTPTGATGPTGPTGKDGHGRTSAGTAAVPGGAAAGS